VLEIFRRLLLLAGLLGGLFAFIYCRPVLISVAAEDFAESKARAEKQPTGFLYKDDTLEEFFQTRTEGRLLRVDDDAWMTFYEQVRAATTDDPGDASIRRRNGASQSLHRLYYVPDEAPVNEVAGKLGSAHPLIYMQIRNDDPAAPTLVFIHHSTADLSEDAPNWLLRPYRPYAIWPIACGLLFYLFLPRPKRRDDTIRCSAVHAIGVPDLLGAFLAAVFFALPVLIIQMNGATFSFADGAWFVPIVVCWFLALFPIVIIGIAAFNASFSIQLADDAMCIRRWNGSQEIAYADVERVEAVEWRTPRWVRAIGWLIVLFSQRGLLSVLILQQGRGAGLKLSLRGGGHKRIWISGLDGWERIVETLDHQGVTIDPDVRAMCEDR
jgi:hypothetical protein